VIVLLGRRRPGPVVTVADAAFSIAVGRADEGNRPEGERHFVDPP